MRKPFIALLLLTGAAAMVTNLAFAGMEQDQTDGFQLLNAKIVKELKGHSPVQLRTSDGPDPDTVWFGHSYTNHSSAINIWNLYTGVNYPGVNDPNNAIWDWDHYTGISAGDSLVGWWPMRRQYFNTGGLSLPDASRPWWCTDYGNQANYVMPQGPGGKRTKGVVGVWHRDNGNGAGDPLVTWTALAGSNSAWCGLRAHGDVSQMDLASQGGTGNAFNQSVLDFNGEGPVPANGTAASFPGYAAQMDQMLYRDLSMIVGQTLRLQFLYKTDMSTQVDLTASTRSGWFHGDPRSLNDVTPGNFISSTAAGAAAPVDSFSVFIGSPVDDANITYSDGNVDAVYDPQRRWFSEVLRINEPGIPYYWMLSVAGTHASTAFDVTVPAGIINSILNSAGNPGRVRLVFRVKTNRGGDAVEGTKTTGATGGAALVDNVIVTKGAGAPLTIGDFEAASGQHSIDNRVLSDPLNVWKSTGKPPSVYWHVRPLKELAYNDLCGPPDSPARGCNISGNVISAGNFDDLESAGDARFLSDRERYDGMFSPTINLVTPAGNLPNEQGITTSIATVTDDYYFWYDMYAGIFNLVFSGNAWAFGAQSYPATQANGRKCWGPLLVPGFQFFNPEPQCFFDIEPLKANGCIVTSNAGEKPDSLRFFIGKNQQCFRFSVSLGCNSRGGTYFDNMAFAFIDLPVANGVSSTGAVGTIAADIWQFTNDAFPTNATPNFPSQPGFDTTTAELRTGLNISQQTGNTLRFTIPGDTTVVAGTGSGMRVDLVFRILPGPGNYQIASPGGRHFPPTATQILLRSPRNQAVAAASGDGSFFGSYLADNGTFGTPGGHAGGVWNYLVWNSARCDTGETNLFRNASFDAVNLGVPVGAPRAGRWASMYHESDPKFGTLGQLRNKCFIVDTSLAVLNSTNFECSSIPGYLTTLPQSYSGFNGQLQTREFTKIIPDGLLTPGSHVQYFYRKSELVAPNVIAMVPDTNRITPQNSESSTDAHRFQQFGVLPDRYKDPAFDGQGLACMLYIDLDDRRGNERQWVSLMDSLGGTASTKYGAHNGWHAPGNGTSLASATAGANPALAIWNRNQNAGTTWDMLGVKASESVTTSGASPGSRLGNQSSPSDLTFGKDARNAPTPEMLRTFYRVLAILTGDVNSGVFGPYANKSSNDVNIVNDFLKTPGGTPRPRGVFVQGNGFGQSEAQAGGVEPIHTDLLATSFGVQFRDPSYQSVSGNLNDCADLITTSVITSTGDIYGVDNQCFFSNDLYRLNPGVAEATTSALYQNVGPNGPYIAGVYKPANATRNWVTLLDGWEVESLMGRYCDSNHGRLAYYYNMFNNVFGSLCSAFSGGPSVTLDTPRNGSGQYVDFMKLRNNPLRAGSATVHFGLAQNDRVQVNVFDVTGRKIKSLADRTFQAGEHTITWDGTGDDGNEVARGVYFTQVSFARSGFKGVKKLTVLK